MESAPIENDDLIYEALMNIDQEKNSSLFKAETFLMCLHSILAFPTYSQLLITTISSTDFFAV